MIIKSLRDDELFELRWFWHHWATWGFDLHEYDDEGTVEALYLGCLCIARHRCKL